MRQTLLGVLVGAGLMLAVTLVFSLPKPVHAQADGYHAGLGGELITHFVSTEGYPHALTVIDPRRQVLGVYHVDTSTGVIALKSVRHLTWDLQLPEFNSDSPSPQDIRNALKQVR